MSKKVLVPILATLVLAGCAKTGDVFAISALEAGRDRAVVAVQQATGKTGSDKYISYLNGLISKADCYIGGPTSTCDYSDGEVQELTAALNEGAKATTYLTTERTVAQSDTTTTTTTAQVTATGSQVASNSSNAKNKNSEMPTSLPKASYETDSVEKTEVEKQEKVEVPETSTQVNEQPKTGVKDNTPVRVGIAVLAGVVILTGGIIVIRKWSRGNV